MRDWRHIVRTRLTELGLPADAHHSMVEELAQHLEDRFRAMRAAGATEDAALIAALGELEGHDAIAAELTAASRTPPVVVPGGPRARPLAGLWQDVRYAARTMRRSPAFTTAAVLTAALSTGPTMAALGVANWLFFRPVPGVTAPDRLGVVRMGRWTNEGRSFSPSRVAYAHVDAIASGVTAVDAIAGQAPTSVNLSMQGSTPRVAEALFVTANYFEVLGTGMAAGRGFHRDEDRDPGGAPVTILAFPLARSLFGSAEAAIGATLRLNGLDFSVIGVARPHFAGAVTGMRPALWLPGLATPRVGHSPQDRWAYTPDNGPFYEFLVRLRPGATFAEADTQLRGATQALFARARPDTTKYETVRPTLYAGLGLDPSGRESMKPFAQLLLCVTGAMVLLGTANLANLFAFRASRRLAETGLRRSLGASTARLVQLHLVEGLLVSSAGVGLGLMMAFVAKSLLDGLIVPGVGVLEMAFDWRVMGGAGLLALLVGVLLSATPARLAARGQLSTIVGGAARQGAQRGQMFRTSLAVAQVALSLGLLVGGLLFIHTLRHLQQVDLGLDLSGVSAFNFSLRGEAYDRVRAVEFHRTVAAHLSTLPGVEAASASTGLPLGSRTQSRVLPPDVAAQPGLTNRQLFDAGLSVQTTDVTPDYFRMFGMRMVAGRTFTDREATAQGPPVAAILSASLAERLFGTTLAIGRQVSFPAQGSRPRYDAPVVGVVNDVRWRDPREAPEPIVYLPFGAADFLNMYVMVRSSLTEAETMTHVRAATARLDANVPMGADRTMIEVFNRRIAQQRIVAWVLGTLSGLGFILAAVGIYGLVSQRVVERWREFGIRMAVGATAPQIARLVARQAGVIVMLGVPIGLLLAGLLSRVVASQLFGVTPLAPDVYATAVVAIVSAVAASVVSPLRRATRVNPADVMRAE